MRITVLGAGSWGTTLAILLANNSHDVALWSYRDQDAQTIRTKRENPAFLPGVRIPESIVASSDLALSARDAELIVTAIPSQYVRSVMVNLKHLPFDRRTVVNVAKGVENGTLMTMSEMLHDAIPGLPAHRIVTLS